MERFSDGQPTRLTREIELAILQRLVDQRECPLCAASPRVLCHVYGGEADLERTHPQRLRLTRAERESVVAWALRKGRRQQ